MTTISEKLLAINAIKETLKTNLNTMGIDASTYTFLEMATHVDSIVTSNINPISYIPIEGGEALTSLDAKLIELHTIKETLKTNLCNKGIDATTNTFLEMAANVLNIEVPVPISLSLIGLTAPALNVALDTTVTATAEYTATVTWDKINPVEPETSYVATITIVPENGYSLNVPENFFQVTGGTATNTANSGVITATFPVGQATLFIQGYSYSNNGSGDLNAFIAKYCNYDWVATTDVSWITILTTSGSAGTDYVYFTIDANLVTSPRSGNIILTSGNKVVYGGITQHAGEEILEISPEIIEVSMDGGVHTVNVTSNTEWHIDTSVLTVYPWITNITPMASSGNGTMQLTFAGNSGSFRSIEINVRNSNSSIPPTKALTINQEATDAILSLTPTSHDLPYAAQQGLSISVTTNKDWIIEEALPDWIINHSAVSGNGNVVWTFDVTTATAYRSHYIRFKLPSVGWVASCNVNQAS